MSLKNPEVRLIIAGSRSFSLFGLLKKSCDEFLGDDVGNKGKVAVISGTAKGADRLGERYAAERGFTLLRYPADWFNHGKQAGVIRNDEMAQNATAAIVFWDGTSPGTKNMIEAAKRYKLRLKVVMFQEGQTEESSGESNRGEVSNG